MHFLFLAAALTGALAAPPVDSAPPGHHALSGQVTTSAGGALADVRVRLIELGRSTTTSPEGRYSFGDLGDGAYSIAFSLVGYAPQVARVTVHGADVTLDLALKESLVELPTIQVTSTPNATAPLSSPQPTAVIEGEDLHAAQSPSLGETLNQVAGVHSLSTGTGIGKPVIRGLTSNRVLVLDDGQRMETQQWGDEHGPNIETATAERIEVIRGPASVLYGSDALGGVINIIPRELPDALGRNGFVRGSSSVAYSTNNRQPDGSLLLEGASQGLGFRGTLSGRTSDDIRTPTYQLWNSGNRAIGASLALGYRGSWGSLAGDFSQRDERIQLTDEDPLATPTQRIATTRGRVQLALPLGGSRLELSTGYERNRRREFEDDTTSTVSLGLLSTSYTADVRLHHPALGRLNGVLGLSGLHTAFDKFGEETLIPDSRVNDLGLFAFEQLNVGRLDLSFGARYDYRRLGVDADTVIGVTAQTRQWSSVVGNLGVLYKLAEPVAIVLNLGRGFRAPSTFDLFSNGVHEGTVAFEHGDSTLKTEKSFNTDLALRLQTTNAAVEIGGFVNWIQDFIYTVPTGATDPGSGFEIYDVTQGNARLSGIEAAAQYHPTRYLHLQGTADYVLGQNTSTGNPLPSMPPFRATYTTRLEGGKGRWIESPYVSIGGETNARQTRFDPAEALFYSQALGGAGYQSKPYTLVNFGTGFTLATSAAPVHVDVTLRNAFDKSYANFLSRIKTNAADPGQGRTLVLRLSTDF